MLVLLLLLRTAAGKGWNARSSSLWCVGSRESDVHRWEDSPAKERGDGENATAKVTKRGASRRDVVFVVIVY